MGAYLVPIGIDDGEHKVVVVNVESGRQPTACGGGQSSNIFASCKRANLIVAGREDGQSFWTMWITVFSRPMK